MTLTVMEFCSMRMLASVLYDGNHPIVPFFASGDPSGGAKDVRLEVVDGADAPLAFWICWASLR